MGSDPESMIPIVLNVVIPIVIVALAAARQ
jgi:hypothetical protein